MIVKSNSRAHVIVPGSKIQRTFKTIKNGRYLLLMTIPAVVLLLLFNYLPMWGLLISFMQYSPFKGFFGSMWVGFKHFNTFFSNPFAYKYIVNTVLLSFYDIIWTFPAPIMFALILNEVRNIKYKKFIQTVSYMPHFYSTVVVVGLFTMFLSPDSGVLAKMLFALGVEKQDLLANSKYFRSIFISSEIWQNTGYGAIIYLAALTSIDPQLYEAAVVDGASKFKRLLYITLPCLMPTIIIMLLLRLGHVMNIGFDRIYLFQKPVTYDVSDVIQTYVYRTGIVDNNFSFASAVGLFNSLVNLIFMFFSNKLTKYMNQTSLW